jgi:hypothetical protein
VKVALPVVRGLHGSRIEGTTRRFKVGDFKTEFIGLGVLRTDIRTVPGRRRSDRMKRADVRFCAPTDTENVCLSGETGSDRRAVGMTRILGCRGLGPCVAGYGLESSIDCLSLLSIS